MSVRISKSGEHVQQGTVIYTADNESDIQSLPTICTSGSTCFCIETSTTYILNNQGEWKVKTSSGGEEGGGSAYPSADARNFPIENDNLTFTTKSKNYNDITKAINQRAGTTNTYSPGQIADAITNLPTPTYQQKSLTPNFSNGNVDVSADTGYDALSEVTIQKDSNLTAENIKKDVTVHGITGSYEGGGGGSDMVKALIERTATEISNDDVETIGAWAFRGYDEESGYISSLTSVSFPNVTVIQGFAFSECARLETINFPKVEHIDNNAFYSCSSIETAIFPKLIDISSAAFNGCSNLNTLVLGTNSVCYIYGPEIFDYTPFLDDSSTATLYVPQDLISSYEADSDWSQVLAHEGTTIQAIEGSPYENSI